MAGDYISVKKLNAIAGRVTYRRFSHECIIKDLNKVENKTITHELKKVLVITFAVHLFHQSHFRYGVGKI
jgi:hypothetical protein